MPHDNESHWLWRHRMAEHIAAELDPDRYGVVAIYLLGSTRNATAGPASDIDLLIHFRGSGRQREDLVRWLDTWSRRLSEMNYRRTGCRTDGLLDAHIVTDADIEQKTSYTIKIGAVTDPALPLKMGPRIRGRPPAPSSSQ
jgi:predicted nucleotidyltransferase